MRDEDNKSKVEIITDSYSHEEEEKLGNRRKNSGNSKESSTLPST